MADARSHASPSVPASRLEVVPGGARPSGFGDDVRAVVQGALSVVRRGGRISRSALSEAVDAPLRALTRRVTAEAVRQPRSVADAGALAAALSERPPGPVLGGATATAVAARVARRLGPLRFLARRTPMWLVAALGPALYTSVSRGAEELGLVASHLALRARATGTEPDPERVRRAALHVLAGTAVDTEAEPAHARLAAGWLRRAVRATLPLSRGVTSADPHRLSAAAAAVPVSQLHAPI